MSVPRTSRHEDGQAGKGQASQTSLWFRLWRAMKARFKGPAEEEALREAIEELIEETTTASGAPTTEGVLLNNVLNLRERTAGDCMVPRADIVAMDSQDEFPELVERMTEHAHSRIPIYRDTLDETIGMVHIKDVLICLVRGKERRIADLLRPVLFVAPSMPASKLLLQMRQTRQHMAMVVDEFGGVDGLVTIEDLVEEIVGEIEDEHDNPSSPAMIVRPDGSLLADGRLAIDAFEARVGELLTPEERETIDTLGGYVFHLAGHVPHIGETVAGPEGRLSFEVLATDQNRIKRVRVRGLQRQDAPPSSSSSSSSPAPASSSPPSSPPFSTGG